MGFVYFVLSALNFKKTFKVGKHLPELKKPTKTALPFAANWSYLLPGWHFSLGRDLGPGVSSRARERGLRSSHFPDSQPSRTLSPSPPDGTRVANWVSREEVNKHSLHSFVNEVNKHLVHLQLPAAVSTRSESIDYPISHLYFLYPAPGFSSPQKGLILGLPTHGLQLQRPLTTGRSVLAGLVTCPPTGPSEMSIYLCTSGSLVQSEGKRRREVVKPLLREHKQLPAMRPIHHLTYSFPIHPQWDHAHSSLKSCYGLSSNL